MTRIIVLLAALFVLGALALPCSAMSLNPFSSSGSGSSGTGCVFGGGGTGSVDPFQSGNGGSSAGDGCDWGGSGGTGSVDPFADNGGSPGTPSPFDDGCGTGDVDPFGDGGTSPVPDPFNDGSGTGDIDPFPIIDPSSLLVPCPFPQTGSPDGSGTCQAEYAAPTDPDGDTFYEDVNGNGRIDFADVTIFFQNIQWIRDNQPVVCFDYNENGNIDFADMILLFQEVG